MKIQNNNVVVFVKCLLNNGYELDKEHTNFNFELYRKAFLSKNKKLKYNLEILIERDILSISKDCSIEYQFIYSAKAKMNIDKFVYLIILEDSDNKTERMEFNRQIKFIENFFKKVYVKIIEIRDGL